MLLIEAQHEFIGEPGKYAFFHSPWRMTRIFHLEEYATKYLRRSLVSTEQ